MGCKAAAHLSFVSCKTSQQAGLALMCDVKEEKPRLQINRFRREHHALPSITPVCVFSVYVHWSFHTSISGTLRLQLVPALHGRSNILLTKGALMTLSADFPLSVRFTRPTMKAAVEADNCVHLRPALPFDLRGHGGFTGNASDSCFYLRRPCSWCSCSGWTPSPPTHTRTLLRSAFSLYGSFGQKSSFHPSSGYTGSTRASTLWLRLDFRDHFSFLLTETQMCHRQRLKY